MQVCTCDICGSTLDIRKVDRTGKESEDIVCPVCKSEVILAIQLLIKNCSTEKTVRKARRDNTREAGFCCI